MREARRFPAPRAAGDLANLLGLPGLLRVARLLAQLSHSGPQHHLFLGAAAKARDWVSWPRCLKPALPFREVRGHSGWGPHSAILPSHPSHLAARDITAWHGTAWEDHWPPHQAEQVAPQDRSDGCRRPGMVQPPSPQGCVSPVTDLLLRQLWEVSPLQRPFRAQRWLRAWLQPRSAAGIVPAALGQTPAISAGAAGSGEFWGFFRHVLFLKLICLQIFFSLK